MIKVVDAINHTRLEDNLNDIQEVSDILDISAVSFDLVTTLCGEYIGRGAYRSVYEYNLDHRYVIKVEPENTGCNLVEYMIWEEVKGLVGSLEWVKDWFAPCGWISPNGKLLTMRKTKDLDRDRPDKVPKFLWDVKPDNFGWIGNKFVCHDYGQLYNMVSYPKGMKKIKWYEYE